MSGDVTLAPGMVFTASEEAQKTGPWLVPKVRMSCHVLVVEERDIETVMATLALKENLLFIQKVTLNNLV